MRWEWVDGNGGDRPGARQSSAVRFGGSNSTLHLAERCAEVLEIGVERRCNGVDLSD